MRDFEDMIYSVSESVQDTSSNMQSRVEEFVDKRYRDIANSYDWEHFYHNQSITTSANVSAYPFDANTERIMYAVDVTNDRPINIVTEQDFLQNYGDALTDTGSPDTCFVKSDIVASQPASAEKMIFKSSSALDVEDGQDIYIRGLTGTLGEVQEVLGLSGTTAVTASNAMTEILGFSKEYDSTYGAITLYDNDGTTARAILAPMKKSSKYKILNLYPIPNGAVTIKIRTKRRATLDNKNNYPPIEDIDYIIEVGAQADAWRYKRQFAKANALETQYQIMKMERIHREVAQPGIIHQFQATPLDRDEGILT